MTVDIPEPTLIMGVAPHHPLLHIVLSDDGNERPVVGSSLTDPQISDRKHVSHMQHLYKALKLTQFNRRHTRGCVQGHASMRLL